MKIYRDEQGIEVHHYENEEDACKSYRVQKIPLRIQVGELIFEFNTFHEIGGPRKEIKYEYSRKILDKDKRPVEDFFVFVVEELGIIKVEKFCLYKD